MGIVFRQSIKTTVITFFGAVLGAILVLVSTNMIPITEYGFRDNLTNQTVVASFFLLLGMNNTLFLYFHRFDGEKDKQRRAVFMSMCFLVPLALFLLSLLPYFLFQDFILDHFQEKDRAFMRQYIWCFPLYTLFYIYTSLLENYMLTQIKSAASSFVREVMLKGLHLTLVMLYGFRIINFDVFIYSFVFINLIAVLVLIMLSRKNNSFKFSTQWNLFSRNEYKEMFRFAGYHALMSITISLLGFLGAILLAALNGDGLDAVPIYNNANFISGVLVIPYRAMSLTASADITRSYAQQEYEKVKDLYKRSGINALIGTVFMALIIVCNLHNAVALMPPKFEAVFGVTIILIIGKVVDSGTGFNDLALNMSPFYRLNFYFSLGLVLFMLVMFRIYIPIYGVYGAAWVFTCALILYNILKTFFVWKKLQLNPFSRGSFTIVLIAIVVLLVSYLFPKMDNPFIDTIVRSAVILLVFAVLVFWLKPSKDVSQYINETLKKKKLF